jgi:hypothetical protein
VHEKETSRPKATALAFGPDQQHPLTLSLSKGPVKEAKDG